MNNSILHRQNLHRIPELSDKEYKTKEYILNVLKKLNCEITEVLNTGVLAYFNAGKTQTVAYRADIDGLPVLEATNLSYASEHEGRMHACGHDCHTAMLLGFAEELNELPRSAFENNILLVFQPAEETIGGAKRICSTGVLDKTNTKAVLGFHVHPNIGKGQIGSRANEFMARTSEVDIVITGKSAHCAEYQNGIDAIEIASKLILRLYEMEREEIAPSEHRLLKFGQIVAGTMRNILPDTVTLKGTYRCFDDSIFDMMMRRSHEIFAEYEALYGCKIELSYTEGYPALFNDEGVYSKVKGILSDMVDFHEYEKPFLIAEDFSFYCRSKPSCFMYLGTGKNIALHNNKFDIDEDVLNIGVQAYLALMNI